jgi:hypothetical protein
MCQWHIAFNVLNISSAPMIASFFLHSPPLIFTVATSLEHTAQETFVYVTFLKQWLFSTAGLYLHYWNSVFYLLKEIFCCIRWENLNTLCTIAGLDSKYLKIYYVILMLGKRYLETCNILSEVEHSISDLVRSLHFCVTPLTLCLL